MPGLAGAEGLYTPETLYAPESLGVAALGKVYAERRKTCPAAAVLRVGDAELTTALVATLDEGALLWVTGRLTALDEATPAAAAGRGLTLQAGVVCCMRGRLLGTVSCCGPSAWS